MAAAIDDDCYDGEDYLRLVINSLMQRLGAEPGPLIISTYCPAHVAAAVLFKRMSTAGAG